MQEHRQADVRIDDERRKSVDSTVLMWRAPSTAVVRWRTIRIGCGWPRPRLALGRAAVEHRRLGPALVERLLGCRRDRLRLLAGELQQRAQHARVSALALAAARAKIALRMCAISPRNARGLARRLRRRELEHHRQVVGQLAGREQQAGLLVGLRRGRSSPARGRASRRARARTGAARCRGRGRTAARSRLRRRADRPRRASSISASSSARRPAGSARSRRRISRISGRWLRASRHRDSASSAASTRSVPRIDGGLALNRTLRSPP